MSRSRWGLAALAGIALLEFAGFAAIAAFPDVVQAGGGFVGIWLACAALNAAAALVVARLAPRTVPALALLFGAAIAFRAVLLPHAPQSSDDMYRYVWDGRVQWSGTSPYRYPPEAPELGALRDDSIWPRINRPWAVTIYPPAAQLAFAGLWRVSPDNLVWTKAAFALADLAAGVAVAAGLAAVGRSPLYAVIPLWHPLPVFEYAHAGHLDSLFILPVALALWARARGRPGVVGALLGVAALIKFYPATLAAALWRWREWRLLVAALVVALVLYLPFVLRDGAGVLGFLPLYFQEEEYASGGRYFFRTLLAPWLPAAAWPLVIATVLGAMAFRWLRTPPATPGAWSGRAGLLATSLMLLVTPSFPWYYGWLLPMLAFAPRAAGLWLCGTCVLAYAWWWLPPLAGIPGPGIWIFAPALALLLWPSLRRWLAARNGRGLAA